MTRHAVQAFQDRLGIRRIGLTYVIQISFRSYSPDRAAQIANAVADAYIDDQLESKYQAARRAGVWLQQRLRELRDQATTAERAVVAFKNSNNMVNAGGRSINEQQLGELNSQLVLAQSQTGEARARLIARVKCCRAIRRKPRYRQPLGTASRTTLLVSYARNIWRRRGARLTGRHGTVLIT